MCWNGPLLDLMLVGANIIHNDLESCDHENKGHLTFLMIRDGQNQSRAGFNSLLQSPNSPSMCETLFASVVNPTPESLSFNLKDVFQLRAIH